jgi:hypothetical protein
MQSVVVGMPSYVSLLLACGSLLRTLHSCAQMMDKLLDRSHLEAGSAMPYSAMGVGYEVVQHTSNNSMISGINA